MKMYILKRKSDGKFFDGRYMQKMWSDKPRLFRSISGMKNAVDDSARALNPKWWDEFTSKNTPPMTEVDSKGRVVWSTERMEWTRKFNREWDKFRSENKGMSFLSDNYEVIEKEI